MPEEEVKGTVEKSFFDQLRETKETIDTPDTYASGNITGITSANQRRGATLTGHYAELNKDVPLDPFSNSKNWERLGYSEQSAIDVAYNTAVGGLINVAAGFLEGVSSNDVVGIYNMSMGNTEERYGNILHEWANDLMQYSNDKFHIYQGGDNSPFSFEYWGKQLQSTGYSVGIIAEMFAEAALLKKVSGSGLKLLSKGTSILSNPMVFGSYQGIKEAYMNGLQTGEQTYRKYLDAGWDEETAKKKANEASTLGFRMEVLPLMTMNALQFASLGKYNPFMKKTPNLGFSGGFETLGDIAFKGVQNKYVKKLADYGVNIAGEAIEEGFQTGIGKEAQYKIGLADGIVERADLIDRWFDDDEMRDSMIGGAIGGGAFRFIGKRVNNLTKGTEVKKQEAEYDDFLMNVAKRIKDDTADLKVAVDNGDIEKADIIRNRMQVNSVFESLKMDLMNQKETAFESYVSTLKDMKEAAESNNIEKMKIYGITEPQDVSYITENFGKYIDDAVNIKEKLISTLESTNDFNAALQITHTSKLLEELTEYENRSQKTINDFKSTDKTYLQLSDIGKQKYNLFTERMALLSKAKHDSITSEQRERIGEINQELKTIEEENKKYKGRAKDSRLLDAIDSTKILKEQINIYEMQDHQANLTERLAYWKDPKNQKQERIERAKKKVSKAKNKEALDQAKESLKQEGNLTPEMEQKINAKSEQVEIKDFANAGNVDTPFGAVVAPTEDEINRSNVADKPAKVTSTPFGDVVTPTVDELKPNKDREKKSSEIVKDLGIDKKGDAIIINNDDLFQPAQLGEFTPKQLEKLKTSVGDYVASLKADLKKEPTFSDFVRDFIKHNTKEATDRAFNALIEGWKANDFPVADFDAVYNEIFKDRTSMTSNILNIAEDMIEGESIEKISTQNEKNISDTVNKKSPTVALDNNTNQPIIKDTNPFRTSSPVLKAAHLSIPYKREILDVDGEKTIVDTDTSEELNDASDVNSNKLLDPNKFGKGTKLTVTIPHNFKEIKVATWLDDYTKGPSMTFGQWEQRFNVNQYNETKSLNTNFSKPYKKKNDGSGLVSVKINITTRDGINIINFETLNSNKKGEPITESKKGYNNIQEIIEDLNITDVSELRTLKELGEVGNTFSVTEIRVANNGSAAATIVVNGNNFEVSIGEVQIVNNKELNPRWVEKVPMIAFDSEGEGVFFIHSNDWYNGINVGFKDDLAKQSEIITEARKNLTDLRTKVITKSSVSIEIEEKRPGTFKTINKDQPALTLQQANPQTQIGIANDQGELVVNGKIFETDGKVLINEQLFERGHTYDIRQTGVNEYMAFKVLRDKLSPASITTVQKAVEVYLFQFDENSMASDNAKNKQIRNEVLKISGLDLFRREDFETYINMFIPTVVGKFNGTQDITNSVQANSKIAHGTPYVSVQKGSLVFGIKGVPISGKNTTLYIHPRKISDQGGPAQMKSMLGTFNTIINKSTQNVSKKGLARKNTMAMINFDGSVTPTKNYEEYLKSALKTNVKSFDIGEEGKPNFVTIIQPVITFKESNDLQNKAVVEQKANPTVIEEAATKIVEEKPMTKVESAISQVAAEEVQKETKAKRAALDIDVKQTLRESLAALRELGVPEDDPSLQFILEQLNEDSDYAPIVITDEMIQLMKEEIDGTTGLSILQDFQVVDYIFNEITSKVDFKHKTAVSKEMLLKDIKDAYFNLIEPKKQKTQSIIENLKKINLDNPNEKMTTLISKMETEIEIFNTIKNNWPNIQDKALEKLFKYTGIQESKMSVVEIEDASTEQEKNYSKSSLEENGKTTASYRLKRFFSGIKQVDAGGRVKTGFLGVQTYVGFDTVYSTIEQVISSPYEIDSNFNEMILRLEDNVVNFPWLRQVIDELNVADEQIKKEFVYNFARHTLSMKFVMFSKNRDNTYTLKVYDTNANEITRVIRNQWESNFKQSPLTYVEDGVYKINKQKAKLLLERFDSWKEQFKANPGTRRNASTVEINSNELRQWLEDFGISLSDETISELKNKPITYMTNDGKVNITFPQMFDKSPTTAGIFGLLADYLQNIITKADTTFEENPDNHPFNNANNVLKTLAKIESKYSTFATTNSFRDGDKSIYGFTPTKHTTDVAKDLKFNQDFRNQLLNKSFNKHSYMLQMLNTDQAFAEKFYVDHLGITSLKELGKKVFGDNSVTALSDSDHELTKLGLFQDIEQGEVNGTIGKEGFVDFRMARMFMPTMSDKSQMLDLHTAVLNLTNKHFVIDSNNNVTIEQELKEIMYSQLVRPELERIYNFVSTIKKTNIKGYDMAAQMFLMIPELNNLTDKKTGKRAISLMANAPEVFNITWFETNFKKKIGDIISNMVVTEVNNKMKEWEESGFFEQGKEGSLTKTMFLSQKYLDRLQGDTLTKVKLAANDFVINNMLTNANVYMMIAGDIALYSQDKISKYFQDGKVYLPKEEYGNTAYAKAVKEVISVNVGKRLALMLAPGNKIANSKGEKYTQVFFNDHIDISSNIETLVGLFYENEDISYVRKKIKQYNADKTSTGRQSIAKELSVKYPEIADYFDIEATDAQEYTTLSEHIHVLYGQGRLSSEQYKTISDKIKVQLDTEQEGKKIPESAMLNYNELAIVLQPFKPVHTGFKNEDRYDTMRMVYVKSSAFPLIPQVTLGTELDKVRRMLENFEKVTGKHVRASYETANKVGSVTQSIAPFNPDGTFNDKIGMEQILAASLTLDRDNFRIQQDVPFKSDKRKEDKISIGTQTLKLLFGDGMLDINGFEFEGKTLNGRELHKKFNDNFNDYIVSKKKSLFNQIGVDKDGYPIDIETTMTKLQDLLKREAIERGYPKQDIEALRLSPTLDSQGKIVDLQFSIPLWLSPNSNRYEALLNAIVSNKLVNLKIPGNAFVVGSEAGFKMTADLSKVNQSRIIFTDKFEGELKAAEFYENGNLKKAQIMLPSKFRDNNGKLIQFIDDKGIPNPLYVEKTESGTLKLKADMIDSELLNLTSFRIPTSAHVSMSQLEIVGILLTEVGDLMIIPRNLTKQKGLDFDVDKENTYQLNTFIGEDGKIRPINEEDRQKLLKIADAKNTESWNDNSPESNLLKAIFGEDPDFILEDIEEGSKLDIINEKISQKLMENSFVRVHSSVLSNPNREVQKKINKVLSMEFAKSQAELVQKTTEENVDTTYFSMLSDNFQKNKMFLGASGKLGIGVYSNYVVFHSMVQQAPRPIQLTTLNEEGEKIAKTFVIGNQTSKGLLGRQFSLAPAKYQRNIAEAFSERQNTATDNEKEQIMGRLNVNEVTINVDSLMTALGFDKDVLDDGTEVSIPYLLLSQPIIKEFVKEIRKTKSNTVQYDGAAESKVIAKLIAKYEVLGEFDMDESKKLLTGQNLFSNLTNANPAIQQAVLNTFLDIRNYATTISAVQSRLNINKNGLGISFFETIDKYNAVQNLPENIIEGVNSLVGEYFLIEDLSEAQINNLIAEGAVRVGIYLIKPNNPVGSMLVHSVQTGYDLWKRYFPYGDRNIRIATNQILGAISSESTSEQKLVQLQQDIFKELKKYVVSSERLGVFEGNPQVRRKELFIDTKENKSLANYTREILNSKDLKLDFLKSNKLLSRFQFDINTNGLPSTIKFDNTKGENFDEDYLYISLIELLEENRILPDKNGKPYTTRDLAQELIAYNYLEGGIQEAVQFAKYIPVSYLNVIPFAEASRKWNNDYANNIFGNILGIKEDNSTSRFTRQYIQHNPQRLGKIDPTKNIINAEYANKSNNVKDLISFEINRDSLDLAQINAIGGSDFVAIYNPVVKKGLKKFQVYEKVGDRYVRISSLGIFGMSEYSLKDENVYSIVNDNFKAPLPSKGISTEARANADIFGIETETVTEVIERISKYDFKENPQLKQIAETIKGYVDGDLTISITDLVNERGDRIAKGRHNKGKIDIDTFYYNTASNEELAKTILHEVIHGLTTDYVSKYVDNEGNYITENTPKEIINLVRLFNQTKEKLGPEIEAYKQKRAKQLSGQTKEKSTERETTVAYAGTNVREFITLVMTEPNFQEEMKNVKFKDTNMSLYDKFVSIVNDIMIKIFGFDYDQNGITAKGIEVALTLIDKQAEMKEKSKIEAMEANDRLAEDLLSTPFGDVVLPTDEELNNLEEPDNNPNFEDPFKCK